MKLYIKITAGEFAGRDGEFDQDEVTISRSPQADIQLHPELETMVGSKAHVRLVRRDGGWVIRCEHKNGVVVHKQHGDVHLGEGEETELAKQATIRVGSKQNGPELRLTTSGLEPVGTREAGDVNTDNMPQIATGGDIGRARKAGPRILLGTGAAMVLALGIGALMYMETADLRDRVTLQRLDLEDVTGSMDDTTAALSDLEDQTQALDEEFAEISEQVEQDFADVLREARDAVVVVGIMDEQGAFRMNGTAWVVGEQQLATNAHVAEGLERAMQRSSAANPGADLTMVARAVGDGQSTEDVEITQLQTHPGYEAFLGTMLAHTVDFRRQAFAREGPGGSPEFIQFGGGYDVALLEVEQAPASPLPLADDGSLHDLQAGDEIAYIGYPSEQVLGDRLESPPDIHAGRLTNLTDLFSQRADHEDALLLHHSLSTVGGASGSPMLNRDGEVVGLVSHGSLAFVGAEGGPAIRMPIGFNYGQRVSMLQELKAGVDEQQVAGQIERWENQLESMGVIDTNLDRLRAILAAEHMLWDLQEAGLVSGEADLNLKELGWSSVEPNQVAVFDLDLEPGRYLIAAATDDLVPVTTTVHAEGPSTLAHLDPDASGAVDELETHSTLTVERIEPTSSLGVELVAQDDRGEVTVEVDLPGEGPAARNVSVIVFELAD